MVGEHVGAANVLCLGVVALEESLDKLELALLSADETGFFDHPVAVERRANLTIVAEFYALRTTVGKHLLLCTRDPCWSESAGVPGALHVARGRWEIRIKLKRVEFDVKFEGEFLVFRLFDGLLDVTVRNPAPGTYGVCVKGSARSAYVVSGTEVVYQK